MTLADTLEALASANLHELREEWRRRYGAPPRLRSVILVRHLLAWRIQADAFGGLGRETQRLLRMEGMPSEPFIPPGTIMLREWRGVQYEVEATAQGFLYRDRTWRSLSEVARAITGTRWNGRRFFGLREPAS